MENITDIKEKKLFRRYRETRNLYNKAIRLYKDKYNLDEDQAKVQIVSKLEGEALKKAITNKDYVKEALKEIIKKVVE